MYQQEILSIIYPEIISNKVKTTLMMSNISSEKTDDSLSI